MNLGAEIVPSSEAPKYPAVRLDWVSLAAFVAAPFVTAAYVGKSSKSVVKGALAGAGVFVVAGMIFWRP